MAHPKQTIDEGEERAVSPVIGVILMVAITVILAAVIGTFVLDLGQNVQNTGPSASMGFSDAEETYDGEPGLQDFLTIEHQSGEQLAGDEIRIVVRNVSDNSIVADYDNGDNSTESGKQSDWVINGVQLNASSTVTVGDIIVLQVENGSGGAPPQAGFDYSITVVSTETDNRIATGTIEVN